MNFQEELKEVEFAMKSAVGGGQCAATPTFREMAVFSS